MATNDEIIKQNPRDLKNYLWLPEIMVEARQDERKKLLNDMGKDFKKYRKEILDRNSKQTATAIFAELDKVMANHPEIHSYNHGLLARECQSLKSKFLGDKK